ncbi:hypothetical protein L227DRAFT_569561 [Lentinus tigrinus ALCF2SS1-6]|uniref:F-box domain-containing protein n=1 Tax=Lentinus tigrinus ALCF2SS1-6 TaxID=1328759 RepID=A0A5C2SXM2_9APHY|nr:hypothetical protein L227DRAFT_569561 [Lentinus tigrinus ALCF2SS1-6]
METLPLETLHHIFLFACSDGGSTGISLSLVSRSYRDIVRPVRYNSVALIGYTNIGTFLRCYRNDRAALQSPEQDIAPIIRHLLLTTDASDIDRVIRPGGTAILQSILLDLFQLIGSTLVTLSYTCHAQMEIILAKCAFPRLQELTFLRNVAIPYQFSAVAPLPEYAQLPRALPSLRKLHVILITTLDHAVPVILARWAHAAPNVTHLRISNLRGGMRGIEWMRDMLEAEPDTRPYPSLAHIVIQPYARPVQATYSGGMTQAIHSQFIGEVEAFQQAAPADLNLVRLEPTGWSQMLLGEWLDGIAGGTGAWPEGKPPHAGGIGRRRRSFT